MYNYRTNDFERQMYEAVPLAWQKDAKEVHVYVDFGLDRGMMNQINKIKEYNPDIPVRFCTLSGDRKKLDRAAHLYNNSSLDSIGELSVSVDEIERVNRAYNLEYSFTPKTLGGIMKEKPIITDFDKLDPVILESPFAGDVKNNVHYAKYAINYFSQQGFAPMASHLSSTNFLDDTIKEQRDLGIDRGLDIANGKNSIVAIDRGISGGMEYGVQRAINEGRKYSFVTISDNKSAIEEVGRIRDIKDAKEYCEQKKQENKRLFESTGFILDNDLADKRGLSYKK